MVYSIVKYGQPVLEAKAATITEFDTPELNNFLEDMFDSMYAAKGVGLAAPQIGFSKRIAVIDITSGENPEQKLVLITSTSEVYGKSAKIPFAEGDDLQLGATAHSRWAYACSKALDEWLALAYYRERKLPVIIARLFNTVGPRQTGRYGMVLPTFAGQALEGAPITVYGTGNQSRCFGHVQDAVEAMLRLLDAPAAVGGVFNIGSDEEVTIWRLAEFVRDAAGSQSEIKLIPYSEAYAEGFEDMVRRVPDCAKLERTIGFRPRTPLVQIIKDVVADRRAQRSGR